MSNWTPGATFHLEIQNPSKEGIDWLLRAFGEQGLVFKYWYTYENTHGK